MTIAALKPALERSRAGPMSLPPGCYVDARVMQAEVDQFFRGGWFGAGRADQVKDTGDYVALDVAGQSIILLRDKAGTLQAFANTCRHRAMRLLDGAGHCRGIRCPFHSWAYRLDGSLVAAPQMDGVEGFDKAENGLIRYRAEERLGFVFVCLSGTAPDLDIILGDFAEIHAPWPLDTLIGTRREEIEVACNWKAFLEVFNEYYHLPFVHPDSISNVYDMPDVPDDVTGAYVTQFGATTGTGGLLQDEQEMALPCMPGLQGRAAAGVRYTWIFPNMTFAVGTDALWVYEAYPLGPNRCKVVQTACFPPQTLAAEGAQAKVAAYHTRLDAALAEDIPALESQHRGLGHPDAQQGHLQPLLEPNVAGFARWYADKMIEIL